MCPQMCNEIGCVPGDLGAYAWPPCPLNRHVNVCEWYNHTAYGTTTHDWLGMWQIKFVVHHAVSNACRMECTSYWPRRLRINFLRDSSRNHRDVTPQYLAAASGSNHSSDIRDDATTRNNRSTGQSVLHVRQYTDPSKSSPDTVNVCPHSPSSVSVGHVTRHAFGAMSLAACLACCHNIFVSWWNSGNAGCFCAASSIHDNKNSMMPLMAWCGWDPRLRDAEASPYAVNPKWSRQSISHDSNTVTYSNAPMASNALIRTPNGLSVDRPSPVRPGINSASDR